MWRFVLTLSGLFLILSYIGCSDPSSSTETKFGKVMGEFQDDSLFQVRLAVKPELANYTEQEIYDGQTGATMIPKWLNRYVPPMYVMNGKDTVAMSSIDAWGLFSFELETGKYQLSGSCEGYQTITRSVTVTTDTVYLNFKLPRE